MVDFREQIISFIKQKGPVLPVQVAKEINSNILMASAHLSELSSNKKIKISNVKVGSSPLYYIPGQEAMLQNFSSNLHEKEQKVYALLSQNKILVDSELEPVFRAAIRQIKDFAIPLQVSYDDKTEIFWKWYLLPASETELLIKSKIKGEQEKEEIKAESKEQEKPEPTKEEQKKLKVQKELKKPEVLKTGKEKPKPADSFFKQIISYFEKNRIEIVEQNIVRKNSEIDFIVKVPSSVGLLMYYCKAKNKKRINDGDLSSAYIQSQSKKIPVLFLVTGQLTKKAKEMLEKEFKGMNIKLI